MGANESTSLYSLLPFSDTASALTSQFMSACRGCRISLPFTRQLEERLSVGAAWEGGEWGDLVFTDELGRPLAYYHVRRRFYNLLRMAGLPLMRYHDLRHGAASLMAAQGVPARVAMEILGHAQISTTMNIYTHVAPEVQKEAAEMMAGALWPEVGSRLVSNPPPTAKMGHN